MNSPKPSVSAEWISSVLAREDRYRNVQPCFPEDNLPLPDALQRNRDRATSIKELDCDPVNIAEIFKEELSYRAQVRRLLWESFD